MNKIGIDLGGTKIEGILLDKQNQVMERIRVPTKQKKSHRLFEHGISEDLEQHEVNVQNNF